jgi:hypothetical protein
MHVYRIPIIMLLIKYGLLVELLANNPLEWPGYQLLSAAPPKTHCLPLRGSVIRIQQAVERHTRLVPAGSTMEE